MCTDKKSKKDRSSKISAEELDKLLKEGIRLKSEEHKRLEGFLRIPGEFYSLRLY